MGLLFNDEKNTDTCDNLHESQGDIGNEKGQSQKKKSDSISITFL